VSQTPENAAALDLFIVAGEVSGDHLGAKLMDALRSRCGAHIRFRGVGGQAMQGAGLTSQFPMEDIAVMGFMPVIARLPQLLKRISETAEAVISRPPQALIIIDSPDFTHRVAKKVRAKLPHLPIIDYVSPTVWAWRPGRARRMRAYVDHVLALLPFEPQAHRELGGPACTYVGHPLIERLDVLQPHAADEIRRSHKPPKIVILPGSRRSEISRLLDTFGEVLPLLHARVGNFEPVLPAVEHLAPLIKERVANWPIKPEVLLGEGAKYEAFRQARAALAASGTVTLELGLAQVPSIVAYKVSKLEEIIARQLIRTKWITLANIVLGEEVYPELLQDAATPAALASHLAAIMGDTRERVLQLEGLKKLDSRMRLAGGEAPSLKAAGVILDIIEGAASSAP
jgi:lipid-A-disaccharide synthase